ncbi:MAG: chromosomal replication initiator protein DnaA [Pseudomonadota bacterium]
MTPPAAKPVTAGGSGKNTDKTAKDGRAAKPPRPPAPKSVAQSIARTGGKAVAKSGTPRSKTAPSADQTDGAAAATVAAKDVRKWVRVQAQMRTKLGHDSYNSWFGRCRLEEVTKGHITLSVPTAFLKSWIKTHYQADLLALWQAENDDVLRVDVLLRSAVRTQVAAAPGNSHDGDTSNGNGQTASTHMNGNGTSSGGLNGKNPQYGHGPNGRGGHGQYGAGAASGGGFGGQTHGGPAGTKGSGMAQIGTGLPQQIVDRMSGREAAGGFVSGSATGSGAQGVSGGPAPVSANSRFGFSGSPLDPNYTFDTLVEGAANRVACAAAKSVAEADGAAARFNPLFLHANVGLGKTHLLQSIAWAAASRNSGMKILYLTAEYFMWRFASAIRDSSALSFKESLREIDLLLIDDMQFLQGKSIQQEFCHLLNALIDSAKQVVVAADRPPSQLESLDDRVRSRLQGGVALEIAAPDMGMREDILRLRYQDAQRDDPSLKISDAVIKYVAETVTSSGRDLEGAFNQLLIQQRFTDGALDLDAIEKLLGHLVQSSEQRKVRIEDIQRVVARHYNVSRNDMLSNRRTRVIVLPRQIAMYLSKLLTPRSLPEIGRRFGGRDHTTVLHAVRKIERLLAEDQQLAHEIELLKRLIHEQGQ